MTGRARGRGTGLTVLSVFWTPSERTVVDRLARCQRVDIKARERYKRRVAVLGRIRRSCKAGEKKKNRVSAMASTPRRGISKRTCGHCSLVCAAVLLEEETLVGKVEDGDEGDEGGGLQHRGEQRRRRLVKVVRKGEDSESGAMER